MPGKVAIDSPAGPREILILADDSAKRFPGLSVGTFLRAFLSHTDKLVFQSSSFYFLSFPKS